MFSLFQMKQLWIPKTTLVEVAHLFLPIISSPSFEFGISFIHFCKYLTPLFIHNISTSFYLPLDADVLSTIHSKCLLSFSGVAIFPLEPAKPFIQKKLFLQKTRYWRHHSKWFWCIVLQIPLSLDSIIDHMNSQIQFKFFWSLNLLRYSFHVLLLIPFFFGSKW